MYASVAVMESSARPCAERSVFGGSVAWGAAVHVLEEACSVALLFLVFSLAMCVLCSRVAEALCHSRESRCPRG